MDLDNEHPNPGASVVRASDADRDRTIEALAAASAEGRLSLEEYSQRSEAALLARTIGELTSLTADLPQLPRSDAASVPAEITAVLGNESRKGPWVVPAHLTVRSVLGDCHLEMQQAVIRQHVTTIDATVRFGTMTIFVPDGIDVRMNGRAVLAAKSSQLRGEPQPGAPVIVVNCNVLCGAVTVRRPDWLMRRRLAREGTRVTEDKVLGCRRRRGRPWIITRTAEGHVIGQFGRKAPWPRRPRRPRSVAMPFEGYVRYPPFCTVRGPSGSVHLMHAERYFRSRRRSWNASHIVAENPQRP